MASAYFSDYENLMVEMSNLSNDHQSFSEALTRVTDCQRKMISEINELSEMWEGPSKEAFMQHYNADMETLDETVTLLNNILNAMAYALQQYRKCDQDVMSVVSGIRI